MFSNGDGESSDYEGGGDDDGRNMDCPATRLLMRRDQISRSGKSLTPTFLPSVGHKYEFAEGPSHCEHPSHTCMLAVGSRDVCTSTGASITFFS